MFPYVLITGNFDLLKFFHTRVEEPKLWESLFGRTCSNMFQHSLIRPCEVANWCWSTGASTPPR